MIPISVAMPVCDNKQLSVKPRSRFDWLDCVRGFAMLLVIYGHLLEDEIDFFIITSPFKIPLFFAITGFIFNPNKDNKLFYKDLVHKLIVPWLCLALFPPFCVSFQRGWAFFGDRFVNVIMGKSIWYMPACIIAEIIFYYINKIKDKYLKIPAMIVCSCIGFILAYCDIGNWFMFNRSMIAQFYLCIGFLFRDKIIDNGKYVEIISRRKIIISLTIVYFSLISVNYLCYSNMCIDVHNNYYCYIPVSLLSIFVGCNLIFCIFYFKQISWHWLSFIGKNTLVFYIWNNYANNISTIIVNSIYPNIECSKYFISAIKLFISIIVLSICSLVIKKIIMIVSGYRFSWKPNKGLRNI